MQEYKNYFNKMSNFVFRIHSVLLHFLYFIPSPLKMFTIGKYHGVAKLNDTFVSVAGFFFFVTEQSFANEPMKSLVSKQSIIPQWSVFHGQFQINSWCTVLISPNQVNGVWCCLVLWWNGDVTVRSAFISFFLFLHNGPCLVFFFNAGVQYN